MRRRGPQWILFAVVCLVGRGGRNGVAGKLVELDMDLVSWLQLWMPWKHFNYTSLSLYAGACYYMSLVAHVWPYVSLSSFTYSAPLAAKYCPQQQCLHCSEPFEWDPHPYQPCRSLVPLADSATNGNMINSTHTDTVKIEVASPHLAFHGLLFCFTAPQVNLTQDTVQVDLIKEGGKICEKVISIVPSYSKGDSTDFYRISARQALRCRRNGGASVVLGAISRSIHRRLKRAPARARRIRSLVRLSGK